MSDTAANRDSAAAVREQARSLAYDEYLAALLAPASAREALITLAAFQGELRRIPLTVRDATLAEIRLQWWRDALAPEAAFVRTGHPTADAVADLIAQKTLDAAPLRDIIDATAHLLYEDGLDGPDTLQAFANETAGNAIRLRLKALNVTAPDAMIANAARAATTAQLALALPYHLAIGRCPVPSTIRQAVGDPRALPKADASAAARAITAALANDAQSAFSGVSEGLKGSGAATFAAFLPLALLPSYLRRLARPNHDALVEIAELSPLTRVGRLWLAATRRKL